MGYSHCIGCTLNIELCSQMEEDQYGSSCSHMNLSLYYYKYQISLLIDWYLTIIIDK